MVTISGADESTDVSIIMSTQPHARLSLLQVIITTSGLDHHNFPRPPFLGLISALHDAR